MTYPPWYTRPGSLIAGLLARFAFWLNRLAIRIFDATKEK